MEVSKDSDGSAIITRLIEPRREGDDEEDETEIHPPRAIVTSSPKESLDETSSSWRSDNIRKRRIGSAIVYPVDTWVQSEEEKTARLSKEEHHDNMIRYRDLKSPEDVHVLSSSSESVNTKTEGGGMGIYKEKMPLNPPKYHSVSSSISSKIADPTPTYQPLSSLLYGKKNDSHARMSMSSMSEEKKRHYPTNTGNVLPSELMNRSVKSNNMAYTVNDLSIYSQAKDSYCTSLAIQQKLIFQHSQQQYFIKQHQIFLQDSMNESTGNYIFYILLL